MFKMMLIMLAIIYTLHKSLQDSTSTYDALLFEKEDYKGRFLEFRSYQGKCRKIPKGFLRNVASIYVLEGCLMVHTKSDCSGNELRFDVNVSNIADEWKSKITSLSGC